MSDKKQEPPIREIVVHSKKDVLMIDEKEKLAYANYEGMYISGDGVGLQCEFEHDSPEYDHCKNLCDQITELVRELRDYIK